jgi:hypothetical protein
VPDLAANPELYRDLSFVTRLPGDRAVFVAPVQDARRADVLPASQGGFPITYDADERWSRPVNDMIDDVLRRELEHSGVFAGLLPQARPDALVLMPSMTDFQSGAVELDMGARTLAEIGVRVQVFGPESGAGKRELLLDQVYSQRETSTVAMVPMSSYRLSARALQVVMQRLLTGLDGSNCSRSNMPVVVPEAAQRPEPAPAK